MKQVVFVESDNQTMLVSKLNSFTEDGTNLMNRLSMMVSNLQRETKTLTARINSLEKLMK